MKRIESMSEATQSVLQCRDEGHTWRHVTDLVTTGVDGRVTEFTQVRQCTECGTRRQRTIAVPSFSVVRTTYTYPDGYLVKPGVRLARSDVRREVFSRLLKSRLSATV